MQLSAEKEKLYNLVISRYIRCIPKRSGKFSVYRIENNCVSLVGSYKKNAACAKIIADILMQDGEVRDAYVETNRRFIASMIKNTRIFRYISPIAHPFSDIWPGLECLDRESFIRGFNASAQELASNSIYKLFGSNHSFCRHIGKMLYRLAGYTSKESHEEIFFLTGDGGKAFAECLLRRFSKIAAQIDDALENKCTARDFKGKFLGIALRQHDKNILRHPFLKKVAIKREHTRFRDPKELSPEMSLLIYSEEPLRLKERICIAEAHGSLSDADIDEFLGYCCAIYRSMHE